MKLLLADDDAVTRTILTRLLTAWGHEVVPCADGAEALAVLRREDSPRLAILDWVMPGKNGGEVCRELRAAKDRPYVYVILLTGKRTEEDLVEGFAAGADDYIVKPFAPHELQVRIGVGERIVQLQSQLLEVTAHLELMNQDLHREIQDRTRAQTELKQAHDELERRVAARTAALVEANELLENEIAQRTTAEEQIRGSLHDKEVLLQEIHHRVKNNLQVVSSLLGLQCERLTDETALSALKDSRDRIRSMALIHEQLYRSDNLSGVNISVYLKELTTALVQSHADRSSGVTVSTEGDRVFLPVGTAIPCGLIINELVSNCLKHAFHGRNGGNIWIGFHRRPDSRFVIVVADDGIGLPADFDIRSAKSLGLQLVRNLATLQLGGTLDFQSNGGTELRIEFPGKDHRR